MYWQYTWALAISVLEVKKPVASSAASAIESFIFASVFVLQMSIERCAIDAGHSISLERAETAGVSIFGSRPAGRS
jgi:hypothetical protein